MKIEKNDMVMVYDGGEKTIHYEEEGTQDGAKA